MTTIADGPAGLARVAKWGKDTEVTDEAIVRRNMDPVDQGLRKLANSAGRVIDAAVVSVVASGITQTRAAGTAWTAASPTILRDILRAVSDVRASNLGYEPDVLLVDDETWAYMASDTVISAAMARETANNPVYTGRFSLLAGLEVVNTSAANMPGGVGTAAFVLDTSQLGFIATENLGGGYQQAGELVESKVMRLEDRDAWRLRARANFIPVVTDPGAGFKITGVRA